jgi:hypothetical protein
LLLTRFAAAMHASRMPLPIIRPRGHELKGNAVVLVWGFRAATLVVPATRRVWLRQRVTPAGTEPGAVEGHWVVARPAGRSPPGGAEQRAHGTARHRTAPHSHSFG